MPTRRDDQQGAPGPGQGEQAKLDPQTFRRLVAEGQEYRRSFERRTAQMRVMTSDDLKTRSR